MEKRLILAIAFSILIIITFQHFVVKPTPMPMQVKSIEQPAQQILGKEPEEIRHLAEAEILDEKELEVETDKYMLTFSNIGGAIKRIRLKDYRDTTNNEPLDLAKISNPKQFIFSISTPLIAKPFDTATYKMEKESGAVIYSLKSGDIEIMKKYILHNTNNSIELQLIIKNTSDNTIKFAYNITGGSSILEKHPENKSYIEVISKVNGNVINFKNPKGGRIINTGIVSWTALKNKYFSIILKPFIQTKNQFYGEAKDKSLFAGIESDDFTIPSRSMVEHKFVIYVGPSKLSALKEFGFEFEETVNYGFFGWIAKAMLSVMGILFVLVHNWGMSIICLSVFLNILLFPLSMQSFKSMKKMQELQPQIEKLKAQCKDNSQKLNKEMLELYKKYKINPLSGCLPLILQMPIFIALYQALIKSIDLRGAGFLWIKDLSSPDAVRMPFTLPLIGNAINILPILMIIGMVVQQKISTKTSVAVTAEQKQQQKMMLIIMPIMFGFIFYNMPSGLVLYWLVNTVLTIFEQSMIFRKA